MLGTRNLIKKRCDDSIYLDKGNYTSIQLDYERLPIIYLYISYISTAGKTN